MAAIEKALRPSLRERFGEIRTEIAALARYLLLERPSDQLAARAALESLAMRLGLDVVEDAGWDDGESFVAFDLDQLDEAQRRARLGQIVDALHHIERALPEGYGDIAERLSHAFRSAR